MQNSKASKLTNSTLDQSQMGDDVVNASDALIKKIEELKNENEELKLTLRAEEDIRTKFEMEIEAKS